MSRRYSRNSVPASYSGWPCRKRWKLRSCLANMSTPAVGRAGEDAIAGRLERPLRQIVAARMGNAHAAAPRRAASDGRPPARNRTRRRAFPRARGVRCRRMCSTAACAARQDQIVEVVCSRAQSIRLGERAPIRLGAQFLRARLGAGTIRPSRRASHSSADVAITCRPCRAAPPRRAELRECGNSNRRTTVLRADAE